MVKFFVTLSLNKKVDFPCKRRSWISLIQRVDFFQIIDLFCFYRSNSKYGLFYAASQKGLLQKLFKRSYFEKEVSCLTCIDPFLIERRFRKVNPELIFKSLKLIQECNSEVLYFQLDVIYDQEIMISPCNFWLQMTEHFIGIRKNEYSKVDIICTLLDILLISENHSIMWLNGKALPLIPSQN